jgi:hypothetical protein
MLLVTSTTCCSGPREESLDMTTSGVASSYLDRLLDQATALAITNDGRPIRPSDFVERYADALVEIGVGGANPTRSSPG